MLKALEVTLRRRSTVLWGSGVHALVSPRTGFRFLQTEKESVHKLKVVRYDPMKNAAPKFESFEVPKEICGPMVLDALLYIKEKIDATLTFRRSCREGICGSCAMNMDGTNGLACTTELRPSSGNPIEVQALPHMPLVRDLVVDMNQFYAQHKAAEPWMQQKSSTLEKKEPVKQSIEDRKKLDGLYECILCACCSTACPSYWWNPDQFMGPAALLQAGRWVEDSRDEFTAERLADLNDTMKLYRCHGIMNCDVACPKNLKPAKVIGNLKKRIAKEFALDWTEKLAEKRQETFLQYASVPTPN